MTLQIGAISAEKLLGMQIDLSCKIRDGNISTQQLGLFLNRKNPFEIPKIIQLGTHQSVEELVSAITDAGCKVTDWAADLMSHPNFTIAPKVTNIEIVIVRGYELGFTGLASVKQIRERGLQHFGYQLCPAEVAPQLRLNYLHQPIDDHLNLVMEPIPTDLPDFSGHIGVLTVNCLSMTLELILHATPAYDDRTWGPATKWVFAITSENAKRVIKRELQDHLAASLAGLESPPTEEVAEDLIEEFCSGCDNLQLNGICARVSPNNQGRYAAREWCGWASVDNVRGQMTSEGFKPASCD